MGRELLHLQWSDCVLLGAALACSSGAIVIPCLEQISVPEPVKITLTLESTLSELVAVLLVGGLLITGPGHSRLFGLAENFTRNIALALLLGVVAGAIWSRLWPLIADHPNTTILNLGALFGVYALARFAGGGGLLAVLVFGVTLANLHRTPHVIRQDMRLIAFQGELSFLVRSFFFVLLGIVAEFVSRKYLLPLAGILAALLLARVVAVLTSRWALRDVSRRETELLFWMLPRGLVTAVLALEIVRVRGPVFGFLPAMAFTVVLVSNLFVVVGAVRCSKSTLEPAPADTSPVMG
jgi:cell volume regulation protein A